MGYLKKANKNKSKQKTKHSWKVAKCGGRNTILPINIFFAYVFLSVNDKILSLTNLDKLSLDLQNQFYKTMLEHVLP